MIYAEIFARSFLVATLTTLICIVLAYPLAWLIARSSASRRDLLVLLVILPFASNFLVRIYAWIMLLAPPTCSIRHSQSSPAWSTSTCPS